jgi:hypothetical protein
MKKLLYKYLSAFYVLDKNGRGNYVIFKDEGDGLVRHDDEKLVKELVEIFGYGYTRTKWVINSWANTIIPHVDLNYYWQKRNNLEFPIARSISSSLIGGDLVSIRPMPSPIGTLMYLDYQYGQLDHPTPQYILAADPVDENPQIAIAKVRNPDLAINGRQATIRKWLDSGLLDDFDYRKDSIAALYEAQSRMLLE